jgi:hypothetical protein
MKTGSFFARLTLLALVMAAAIGVISAWLKVVPAVYWWLAVVFLWALTLLTYRLNMIFVKKPAQHIRALMLGNLVRMFLSLLFVGGVIWKSGQKDIGFIAVFFLGYFIFTFFEILAVLPNLRPDSKETPAAEDGRKT